MKYQESMSVLSQSGLGALVMEADSRILAVNQAGDALLLTELRKTVLIAANRLPEDADLSAIEEPCRLYFADTRRQTTYLAFCAEEIAGVGSVDYHIEMPTVSNPTGECAFLMNIYTAPAYRRRGVARRIVEKLIEDAKTRGIRSVLLEATEMGGRCMKASVLRTHRGTCG